MPRFGVIAFIINIVTDEEMGINPCFTAERTSQAFTRLLLTEGSTYWVQGLQSLGDVFSGAGWGLGWKVVDMGLGKGWVLPKYKLVRTIAIDIEQRVFGCQTPVHGYINVILWVIHGFVDHISEYVIMLSFDHGLSAAVVSRVILNCSASSITSSLMNSPPLSVRNFPGVPKMLIQCFSMALTMVPFFLSGMIHALLYLVAWSIMWRSIPSWQNFRSMATVSLNALARGKPVTGDDGVRL